MKILVQTWQVRVKEGPRGAWLCDTQRILRTQCKSVGHQWRLEGVPTCASGHDGSGVFYITGQMDVVEWWAGRDVRLMRVITVVNEVFNEEMLLMGRVRSDEVITAEDLMLQKTIHEMDFADWLKWVQLVL